MNVNRVGEAAGRMRGWHFIEGIAKIYTNLRPNLRKAVSRDGVASEELQGCPVWMFFSSSNMLTACEDG